MLTVEAFLQLDNLSKATLLAVHVLEVEVPPIYPSWSTTGWIIEHLKRLGFNVQYAALGTMSDVALYSYLGDLTCERARVHLFLDPPNLPPEFLSHHPDHDAIAIAALMAANVIEFSPADATC